MAYSVSIAPLAASAVIGATTNFTATTSGAAAEGTETFVWTVNGVKQSSVTAAMNYVAAGPAGSKTVKVVATVTPAEGAAETAEAETTLTVQNKTMPAITLTLSPTSVSKEIGQSQVVTANVVGAPEGASIAYVWKRGTVVIEGQTAKTITITEPAEANYTLNCEVTVSASNYNPATATNGIEVVFTKKTMGAVSVTLTPSSITAEKGAEASFKADVTGAPAGASVAYSWTKDGSPVDGSTNTLEVDTSTIGSQVIEVSAVVSAPDYKSVTVTKTGNVTITKKTMSGVSVTLTPESIMTEQGSEASFKANVIGAPGGATGVYSWTKDGSPVEGSTSTLAIDTSDIGSQVIGVSVVVSAADYNPVTVTKTGNVTVTAKVAPAPKGELPYVHPLPHRTSAYIWCGWWVMDEIQKMTEEGKDWKTDDPDSKYYLHRYTLQKMMKDYPEVDVQESRNGYIIHKTALETGIIYTYP
ncbi:Hoc-like head decoration [Salmonella phage SG1]|uniref:Highly immunogenic outer capsid protein n=1 Tax=Salmonella phage SG1 TaxID=2025823 RepID=A0A249XVT9_9CAUD|nr:Hoc-like head decoration [Salmonella phage SG1]ASZ76093.1 head decoration protein [Salmonella phage SG1]